MMKNFQDIKLLGNGAHGNVFLVKDKQTQQLFARKELYKPCIIQRQLMKTLNHPNILKMYDQAEEQHKHNLLLEYVEGGDLRKYIDTGFELEENLILTLLAQIALAINYLHSERAIIHRDIKVENVLIGKNGLIKLADFGISRQLKKEEILAWSEVGTPLYLSPERILQKSYDYKSDIWGLGCIIYELMAKQKPFLAKQPGYPALMNKILSEDPQPLPNRYSEQLRSLVLSMLQKKPADRPTALQILQTKEIRKELLKLREKYPQYKECKHMTQVLDNAPTSKFNEREQINLPLSSVSRTITESMKTAKSKSSISQHKFIPQINNINNKNNKKENNLIDQRFYQLSLPFFVEEAKKKVEKQKK